MTLRGYRTLAETGRVLGVDEARVREFIESGPLNAVETAEGLKVHDDDLAAFRRPLFLAASDSEGVSALCKLFRGEMQDLHPLPESQHLATGRTHGVAQPEVHASAIRARHLQVVR